MGDNENTMMLSQTWRTKRFTNSVVSQKIIFLVLNSICKSSKFEADKTKKGIAHYKSRKEHKWHIILCMMFPLTIDLKQVSLSDIEMLLSKLSSTNTIPTKISNNT